jgi:hypothetical protein
MSKKNSAPQSAAPMGERLFSVTVTALAWTEKQANSVKTQIEMILAGYDAQVTISSAAKAAPWEAKTTEEKTAMPGAVTLENISREPMAPALVPVSETAPLVVRPFSKGDTLTDKNTPGLRVEVVSVDDKGFRVKSLDGDSAGLEWHAQWMHAIHFEKEGSVSESFAAADKAPASLPPAKKSAPAPVAAAAAPRKRHPVPPQPGTSTKSKPAAAKKPGAPKRSHSR